MEKIEISSIQVRHYSTWDCRHCGAENNQSINPVSSTILACLECFTNYQVVDQKTDQSKLVNQEEKKKF